MLRWLRDAFISGLLLLAPVGVTVFVVWVLIANLGAPLSNRFFFFVDAHLREEGWFSIVFDLLSALLVVVLITLFGWFSKLLLGRLLIRILERLISRLPLVKGLYAAAKQIVETFSKQPKAVFQEAVLIEYPRRGIWAVGFLTSESQGEIPRRTGEELLNVFLPTTPNPTSGFLLMVPKASVIRLNMTIADAMKLIISGGAVAPAAAEEALPAPVEVRSPPPPT